MKRGSVPIGRKLRKEEAVKSGGGQQVSILSLEEQITALERSADASSSDSDSSDDSDDDSDKDTAAAERPICEFDGSGKVVKIVSSLANERIAPLPKSMLPSADCGPGSKQKAVAPVKKRAIRFADEGGDVSSKKSKTSESSSSSSSSSSNLKGMEATIKDMLRDYKPTSGEKKPFWCRICQFQGTTEKEFTDHRASEFHITAAKIEAKMSYCNLCRKQFTSPAQLKEHLDAKGHKERLARIRGKQEYDKSKNYSRI